MFRLLCAVAAATLVALIAGIAHAQGIRGTVHSGGAAVVGATVRVLELDRAEHTGVHGEFAFADVPRGTYRVVVSADGFAPANQAVDVAAPGGAATTAFDLTPSAPSIEKVVVSASPVQPADSKSQVALLNSPGTSFAEKIGDLPGVATRFNGSAPSRPILRGLGGNDVLVLENGLRMGDIATFDPAHATPLDALEISRVDVVRGPAAILYGPNTLGGFVNVITDVVPTVADHAVSGTVNIEGNSVSNEYSGFARSVWSTAHSALGVSAGTVGTRDIAIPAGRYTDPASGGTFNLKAMPQTDEHVNDAGVGYAYQNSFGTVGIGAKHFEANYGITGDPPNANWPAIPPTTSRISQQRNTIELRSLIDHVKLTANYNDYTHSEFPTAEDSSGVSSPQANHFHKREFNGTLQFAEPVGRWQGTVGLWTDIQDLTIEGQQPLGPNSTTVGLAAYAYEAWQAARQTRFEGGVRYDYDHLRTRPFAQSQDSTFQTIHSSRNANALTASVGVVQRLGASITASLDVARSFRPATVQELFANGLDASSGTYSIGRASLGPETGFGIDPSLRGAFHDVSFELSPFLNVINNYIFGFLRGDTLQGLPVRQFAATDARLMGFEASVTVQPLDALSFEAASDYVNATDTKHDMPLPFIPPLRGLLRGTYQDRTYMGMMELRLADSQHRLGAGDTPTGGYAVMNVGVGVRFPVDRMVHNISIHCDNVFNTVYRDNLSVAKDFIPQPARGFRVNYELIY